MEEMLEQLLEECRPAISRGRVATYIPELAKSDPNDFGICIVQNNGRIHHAGDDTKNFTLQSIVKPILLLQALMDNGEDFVRSRIGVESTGKPFDAINVSDQALLSEHLNPMVNMGAIAMCSLIHGNNGAERSQRLLELTRTMAGNRDIQINEAVYLSEKSTGHKNRALAYLLKSHGLLQDDVEDVLDCYFRACSISVNCRDLARIGSVLANRGKCIETKERLFPSRYATYVNAVMMTCGMYDGSGDFAVNVGVPAKSGVGGGIMAVVPTSMSIGIYSPALDAKGNSIAGIQALERLSRRLYLSVF